MKYLLIQSNNFFDKILKFFFIIKIEFFLIFFDNEMKYNHKKYSFQNLWKYLLNDNIITLHSKFD